MQTIPTVRVANPADPSKYMVINAADYRERVHGELWPEQAPGYAGLPAPPPSAYADAERKFAADLMLEVAESRCLDDRGASYSSLSPGDRMTFLRDMRDEFERVRDQRRAAREERRAALRRSKVQVPEGVVPGETPGWPVDAATGEPLDLTDEERARLAANPIKQDDGALGRAMDKVADNLAQKAETKAKGPGPAVGENPGTQLGTGEYAQDAKELPLASSDPARPEGVTGDGAPSWTKPAAAPAPAPKVEKGPGGKWYVTKGGKPASKGFATKAEAEKELEAAK